MSIYPHSLSLLRIFSLIIVLLPLNSTAITVIRADIEIGGIVTAVEIGLFENQAPLSVNNFQSYINDGDYENSLVYRNAPGFVIQTGGFIFDETLNGGYFIYDSVLDQYNGGLQPVASKGSILNEFKLPNKRGSVAMAILSGEPDSATNEWFINLVDNVEQLDIQNGGMDPGFTVFGEILGDGMDVIDQIAGLQPLNFFNFNPAFASFPVNNYILNEQSPEDLVKSNLVIINSFSEIYQITTFVNYGDVPIGNTLTKDILISNKTDAPLVLGDIDTSGVTPPFTITSNPCQNITLMRDEQCIIQAEFTRPATPDYFNDQFDINVVSENKVFRVLLTNSSPDVDSSIENIDFGLVPIFTPDELFPERIFPIFLNRGDKDLQISSITLDGQNKSEFEIIDNCISENNIYQPGKIAPGGFCSVGIIFRPTSLNEKFASLSFFSDDPDTPELIIPIHGGATTDNDNIPSLIENNAPNNGDGNNDDLPDSLQDYVVSFLTTDSTYMTIVTDEGLLLNNITAINVSELPAAPDGAGFYKDAFSFELSGIPVGTTGDIGLILPAGVGPENIYVYGPTNTNTNPHWYALENNSDPGVFIFGNVALGIEISRNISLMKLVDGGIGDTDMTANGVISFTGAIDFPSDPDLQDQDNGGSISLFTMMLFILSGWLARSYRRISPTP